MIQLVECREINLKDTNYVANLGSASFYSGKSNPVVDKCRQDQSKISVKDEWDTNAYDENNVISSTTPTVKGHGFTCDYLLEVSQFSSLP